MLKKLSSLCSISASTPRRPRFEARALTLVIAVTLSTVSGCAHVSKTLSTGHEDAGSFPRVPLGLEPVSEYTSTVVEVVSAQAEGEGHRLYVWETAWVQGYAHYASGRIEITRGMLNVIFNEDELACLIGHEIGHHELGHAEERFGESRYRDMEEMLSGVSDLIPAELGLDDWVDQQLNEVATGGWSRSREEEADEYGALLAARAGYDPFAFVDLFDRLANRVKGDASLALINLKGSHKALDARARHLAAFLRSEGYEPDRRTRDYVGYMNALSVLHSVAGQDQVVLRAPDGTGANAAFMKERINQETPLWPSPSSQRLMEKLAEQDSWDLVAAGIVGADWYLRRRPAKGGTDDPLDGIKALKGQAVSKAYFHALYAYIEAETGTAPPSAFDGALAAKIVKNESQRRIIRLHIVNHGNEMTPHEREFWNWYESELIPGYHDIYGD